MPVEAWNIDSKPRLDQHSIGSTYIRRKRDATDSFNQQVSIAANVLEKRRVDNGCSGFAGSTSASATREFGHAATDVPGNRLLES